MNAETGSTTTGESKVGWSTHMLNPGEVTCLQILDNISPQQKTSSYPFLLPPTSLYMCVVDLT